MAALDLPGLSPGKAASEPNLERRFSSAVARTVDWRSHRPVVVRQADDVTGLVRAAGIPAKFAIGFSLPPERGAGPVGGYHCWSEFYLDGYGWVPVDASEASKHPAKREYYFGAQDESRVEFTEGRDIVLSPRQQGEPLNFFIYPYVEADGRQLDGVHYEFSYRDIGEESPR